MGNTKIETLAGFKPHLIICLTFVQQLVSGATKHKYLDAKHFTTVFAD